MNAINSLLLLLSYGTFAVDSVMTDNFRCGTCDKVTTVYFLKEDKIHQALIKGCEEFTDKDSIIVFNNLNIFLKSKNDKPGNHHIPSLL